MVAKKTKENTIEAHLNPTPIKLQIQKNQTQLKPTSHQHSISENHFSDPKQSRNPFCRLVMFGCCGRSWSLLSLSTATSDCHQTLCLYRPCLSLLFSVLTEASWPWLYDQLLLPLTATTTVDDDASNWLCLSLSLLLSLLDLLQPNHPKLHLTCSITMVFRQLRSSPPRLAVALSFSTLAPTIPWLLCCLWLRENVGFWFGVHEFSLWKRMGLAIVFCHGVY